jgi:hypothetical protein
MASQNFHEQLSRQIAFLRNSVTLYDSGCREEAIRMAVVMRVLFHDTGNSTSLLKHFGIKDTVQIVTTAKSVEPESLSEIDFGELMGGMTFGQEFEYDPVQLDVSTIRASDWWNQSVFIRQGRLISRKQIVLAAVNKDGGAHVDEPDVDLLAVQEGFWIQAQIMPDDTMTSAPIENNHFRMLRRFADELLNSTELMELVK